MGWNEILRNWVSFFIGTPIRALLTVLVILLVFNAEDAINMATEMINTFLPFVACLGLLYLGFAIMLQAVGVYLPPFGKS